MNNIIEKIRKFNRFYTQIIGVINQDILNSSFSLSEARVIWEIGSSQECTASKLIESLSIDAGYLSRILKRFEKEGLLQRLHSPVDKRIQLLCLTPEGQGVLKKLEEASNNNIKKLISGLAAHEQSKIAKSMTDIQRILAKDNTKSIKIRQIRRGTGK